MGKLARPALKAQAIGFSVSHAQALVDVVHADAAAGQPFAARKPRELVRRDPRAVVLNRNVQAVPFAPHGQRDFSAAAVFARNAVYNRIFQQRLQQKPLEPEA